MSEHNAALEGAEREIDASVRALPLLRTARAALVRGILQFYSDMAGVLRLKYMESISGKDQENVEFTSLIEDRLNSGAFMLLKWALALAPDSGVTDLPEPEEWFEIEQMAERYEAFADALKHARKGRMLLRVDRDRREIVGYEGGDVSGFDHGIIAAQRREYERVAELFGWTLRFVDTPPPGGS